LTDSKQALFYSLDGSTGLVESDWLIGANKGREDNPLFFIGRAGEEFGYLKENLTKDTTEIYVWEHETETTRLIAPNLAEFLAKYSHPLPDAGPDSKGHKRGFLKRLFGHSGDGKNLN
jgi:hypothetical protein